MIREIAVIIIFIIWVMCFHLKDAYKINDLECEIRKLEKRVNELEKTVYIVPRE